MGEPKFTRGPWWLAGKSTIRHGDANSLETGWIGGVHWRNREANAHLISAAPDLYDAVNALLGLIQLVTSRDDCPPAIREALTTSHRVDEANQALAKARGEA
jgi:hypothetical protein